MMGNVRRELPVVPLASASRTGQLTEITSQSQFIKRYAAWRKRQGF